MLQFQVASAIQEAIVREYSEYQENDVSIFVGWLIQYCIHHIRYQKSFCLLTSKSTEIYSGCDITSRSCGS